jgi:serine/threonine protein kinase
MVAVLARAVEFAHQQGVVHRDIKPQNVMVDRASGQPILMDFGLAKEMALTQSELTQSGQVLGTPAYMAPEQAAGQLRDVGPWSDIYALGAVLYHLLCGRPPYVGNSGEVLRQVQVDEPPAPHKLAPHTHRDLETICLTAMAREPLRRYASAAALASDLQRFIDGEAILARREGCGRGADHDLAAHHRLVHVLRLRNEAHRRVATSYSRPNRRERFDAFAFQRYGSRDRPPGHDGS